MISLLCIYNTMPAGHFQETAFICLKGAFISDPSRAS